MTFLFLNIYDEIVYHFQRGGTGPPNPLPWLRQWMNPLSPPAQLLLLFLVRVKYEISGLLCGGRNWYRRAKCQARNEKCDYYGKIGHYIKCCMSRKNPTTGCVNSPCLSSLSALHSSFPKHVITNVKVNDIVARALIDIGSTNNYLSYLFVDQNHIKYTSLRFVANMANMSLKTEIHGICNVKLQFLQHAYC